MLLILKRKRDFTQIPFEFFGGGSVFQISALNSKLFQVKNYK